MNSHWARAKAPLTCLFACVALAGAGGCQKPKAMASSSATSVVASEQDNRVPGGETVEVPARTGSQASGTIGSSTVIGAPAKGQTGLATAH
jgi:hypothetical protein